MMSSRNRNNLPNNLAQLQNLIKRDPESYREEFLQQWRHFQSNLEIFKLDPSKPSEVVSDISMFIAQVGGCYEAGITSFPIDVVNLLAHHYSVMCPELRMTMCKALMLLRNKNLVSPLEVLELFFKLLRAKDKLLRKTLYSHIVTDVKNINAKHKNNKVNTVLQNYMFSMLNESHSIAAKTSLDIMIELYRRNVWNDVKTVNVIVTACHSKITKVMVAALKFFLGSDTPEEAKHSDSESEDEELKAKKLMTASQVSKKTGKKARKLEKALSLLRKSKMKQKPVSFNFSAIHLINDPQGFAEKLFKQVEHSADRFEVKLMVLNLIARLVGLHELILLNYYPFLQRFLQPHQREVTKLLMFAAQSAHEMVPPDAIEPVLMTIANNFVSERNSNEVMAVGLNGIREICSRCPLAMTPDLLQDLVQYKNAKNKTVMMAARSLMQLYRNVDPTLLHKKDRGKPVESPSTAVSKNMKKEFAAVDAPSFVPGADLLIDHVNVDDDEDIKEGSRDEWLTDEDDRDSDGSGEWIDVSHSEDDHDNVDDDKEDSEKEHDNIEGDKKKAEMVSLTRILTDEDFKKIQEKSITKQMDGKSRKRKSTTLGSQHRERDELVDLSNIENVHKKMRHDKESRLATVLAGREGREKFSKPKSKRQNENASTTNKEKLKHKPFMMISHSSKSRAKGKKSFREKQVALRDALLKREGRGRNNKKK
ncbi:protein SDA1 homolog isoform X1 [Hydractinia symbiolongicarpus]|uniref:protein SDA1 homolog isoform X1 n=1 Tax=Hydractinia symbiolongicarpus TaxID=13093 RepID=UPI00254F9C01|nr:protein SDA1 homolog isoform X1 [Hydractinia symbiolongicarpus]